MCSDFLFCFVVQVIVKLCLIFCRNLSFIAQCLIQMMTHRVFKKSLALLSNNQITKIVFNTLEGNYALCLLGKHEF